jgi:ABC-2 type transport system ATP-binding protein
MIQICNVSFSYKRNNPLYKNIQLSLESGHIYGLLGKNGAGKSTLLKLITGLVFPTTGNIIVLDQEPIKRRPEFLQNIFLIPEEIDIPDLHVLSFADEYAPFYPNFDKKQFLQLLNDFEVPLTSLKQMSYGQKKKSWICLGIAANTPLLIFDEPTNGLDIPSKRQFRRTMAAIMNAERCVIISTHQVRDLDSLIDSILILDEGELIMNASINDITQKIIFKHFTHEMAAPESIYSENNLMGVSAVLINEHKEDSNRIDTELFFNACIANKDKIQKLFN